jgi:hypothetical protein
MKKLLLLLALFAIASPSYGQTIPVFSVDKNGTDQAVTANTLTQLTWPHVVFDTNSNFATDTFTPTVAGKYLFTAMAGCPDATGGCSIWFYKNGVQVATGYQGNATTSAGGNINVSNIIDMNGTTDAVQVWIDTNGINVSGAVRTTYFSGALVGTGSVVNNGSINSDGRLTCSGANCSNTTGSTTLAFCPYAGNLKTTAFSGVYTIPAACLTATTTSMFVNGTGSTSLAANTTYYIYLWNNSGTIVLDASTTGHATDSSTGIEIKSGDNTRTLVGMIRTDTNKKVFTNGSTAAAQTNNLNTVATWDNRVSTVTRCWFTANRTSTSNAGPLEVNSENRCNFMSWGDAATVVSSQNGKNNTANMATESEIYLDAISGTPAAGLGIVNANANQDMIVLGSGGAVPSEGYHFTILATEVTNTSTATFYASKVSAVYNMQ